MEENIVMCFLFVVPPPPYRITYTYIFVVYIPTQYAQVGILVVVVGIWRFVQTINMGFELTNGWNSIKFVILNGLDEFLIHIAR